MAMLRSQLDKMQEKCHEESDWRPSRADMLNVLNNAVGDDEDSPELAGQERVIEDLRKEITQLYSILEAEGVETFTDRGGNIRVRSKPEPKEKPSKSSWKYNAD